MSTISSALSAYTNAAGAFGDTAANEAPAASGGVDFASMIRQGAEAAIETGKKGEAMSEAALTGKADIRDVVAAVNNAQITLQTVVAVRDKVITAYNDILHMAI
jgi:flagellar hook-basal body complex protein FliE